MTKAASPLDGLVVVELGHSVAAPFAGQILGELGATVIKVENPDGGEDARSWGPPFWEGSSATFQSLNRDKLGVTVNLKDAAELERLRRYILERADIVIQNMRPGLVDKFGLGATLRDHKPALIYCNLGAFGAVGPMRLKPGYDPLMQAAGGIMSMTGEDGRPPVRVGPSIVDMASGMWAVIGVLSALRRRDATGLGCVVDTSLYETALAWMTVPSALYRASGKVPGRTGSEVSMIAPYKAFPAADGFLMIAAGNDNLFGRLARALGRPEWITDPRFRTNPDRVDNRYELNRLVQEVVGQTTRAELLERLDAAGVPCAPLQSVAEMLADPQTRALGMEQTSPDGRLSVMGLPLSFDGERPQFRRSPPKLGEHNDHVFDGIEV